MATPPSDKPTQEQARAAMPRSLRIAKLLDAKFRFPGTNFRFGIDPILGLFPVVGDTISLLIGLSIVFEARLLKVRRTVLLRMLWNLGVDWLIGSIPIVGNVADFFMKPNRANARLLAREVGLG